MILIAGVFICSESHPYLAISVIAASVSGRTCFFLSPDQIERFTPEGSSSLYIPPSRSLSFLHLSLLPPSVLWYLSWKATPLLPLTSCLTFCLNQLLHSRNDYFVPGCGLFLHSGSCMKVFRVRGRGSSWPGWKTEESSAFVTEDKVLAQFRLHGVTQLTQISAAE